MPAWPPLDMSAGDVSIYHRGTTFLQHPYAVLLPPRPPLLSTLRLPGNLPRVPAANTRHLLDQPTPRPTNELSNPLLSLSLSLEFVRSFSRYRNMSQVLRERGHSARGRSLVREKIESLESSPSPATAAVRRGLVPLLLVSSASLEWIDSRPRPSSCSRSRPFSRSNSRPRSRSRVAGRGV